jgi:hypothetical protein
MAGWRQVSLAVLILSLGREAFAAAAEFKSHLSVAAQWNSPAKRGPVDAGSPPETAARVGISDSDIISFSPWIAYEMFPPPGDLRLVQAIVISHRTPMVSLTIPMTYNIPPLSGPYPFLQTLVVDSTVVTAPGVWGVTFGPGGHDSLWSSRLIDVDNSNRTILLRFAADTPVSPRYDDTLCYLHWLIPEPKPIIGGAIIDTATISGEHLRMVSPTDTVTPQWFWGGVGVGEAAVQDTAPEPPPDESFGVHPNPFNSQVRVHYYLKAPERITLIIYSSLGRRVRSWPPTNCAAGPHEWVWDARDEQGRAVGSGAYYFVLEQNGHTAARAGVLLK